MCNDEEQRKNWPVCFNKYDMLCLILPFFLRLLLTGIAKKLLEFFITIDRCERECSINRVTAGLTSGPHLASFNDCKIAWLPFFQNPWRGGRVCRAVRHTGRAIGRGGHDGPWRRRVERPPPAVLQQEVQAEQGLCPVMWWANFNIIISIIS